jgi:hypothetical protein
MPAGRAVRRITLSKAVRRTSPAAEDAASRSTCLQPTRLGAGRPCHVSGRVPSRVSSPVSGLFSTRYYLIFSLLPHLLPAAQSICTCVELPAARASSYPLHVRRATRCTCVELPAARASSYPLHVRRVTCCTCVELPAARASSYPQAVASVRAPRALHIACTTSAPSLLLHHAPLKGLLALDHVPCDSDDRVHDQCTLCTLCTRPGSRPL